MVTRFQSDLPAGRQRALALGAYYATVATEIRERGMEAAREAVACMGGVAQPMHVARTLLRAVERAGEVPAHRVRQYGQQRMVEIPHLSWRHCGRRQIGELCWWPMFGFSPIPRRPLP